MTREKKINIFIIIFSILVIGIYLANIKIKEKTVKINAKEEYSFVNDNEVIGKWVVVDYVEKIEDYKEISKDKNNDYCLKKVTFLTDGKFQMNDNSERPWFKWTKGKLYHFNENTVQKYYIKEISGKKVLFLERPNGIFEEMFERNKNFYVFVNRE